MVVIERVVHAEFGALSITQPFSQSDLHRHIQNMMNGLTSDHAIQSVYVLTFSNLIPYSSIFLPRSVTQPDLATIIFVIMITMLKFESIRILVKENIASYSCQTLRLFAFSLIPWFGSFYRLQ